MNEWTNERMNEWTNERRNERMNKQTNKWTEVPCVLQDFVPFGAAAQKAKVISSSDGSSAFEAAALLIISTTHALTQGHRFPLNFCDCCYLQATVLLSLVKFFSRYFVRTTIFTSLFLFPPYCFFSFFAFFYFFPFIFYINLHSSSLFIRQRWSVGLLTRPSIHISDASFRAW